jgi:hypothetical protein
VLLELRHQWADGTTHLTFEPLELLERLAALTPRPRINLVLYYGVLGARSAWRPAWARLIANCLRRCRARGADPPGTGLGRTGRGPSSCSAALVSTSWPSAVWRPARAHRAHRGSACHPLHPEPSRCARGGARGTSGTVAATADRALRSEV